MWWNKNKKRVLAAVAAAAVLAAAFYFGGGAPGLRGWRVGDGAQKETAEASEAQPAAAAASAPAAAEAETQTPAETAAQPATAAQPETAKPSGTAPQTDSGTASRPGGTEGGMSAAEKEAAAAKIAAESGAAGTTEQGDPSYSGKSGMQIDSKTGKDKYQTDPVPEGKPVPVEPQDAVITDKAYTCTLSISCAAILDHMDWLDPDKKELVPEDGWILKPTQVTFYEGESVFNVLLRTCKQNKIHMEYEDTPVYNSAYIEGIHNLYEFDCGELSGWMYQVNGWFPNYGCSRYSLQDGDVIGWVYTCDLGNDVGGGSAAAGN